MAVHLLALAASWQVAAALIVAERLGKAIRIPGYSSVLAFAQPHEDSVGRPASTIKPRNLSA